MIPIHCSYKEIQDTEALVPNPKNPNQHPKKQIEFLAKIIKQQGWRNPIVVSKRSGFVVKGHARLEAAKELGEKKVPVDLQKYESEAMEWADMIADNKIAELAQSDDLMIQEIALDLGPDFDFDLLGIPDFFIPGVGNINDAMQGLDVEEFKEFVVVTFKLKDGQLAKLNESLKHAKKFIGDNVDNEENQYFTANALTYICEKFIEISKTINN